MTKALLAIDGDGTGIKVLRRELGVGEDCWLSNGEGAPRFTRDDDRDCVGASDDGSTPKSADVGVVGDANVWIARADALRSPMARRGAARSTPVAPAVPEKNDVVAANNGGGDGAGTGVMLEYIMDVVGDANGAEA